MVMMPSLHDVDHIGADVSFPHRPSVMKLQHRCAGSIKAKRGLIAMPALQIYLAGGTLVLKISQALTTSTSGTPAQSRSPASFVLISYISFFLRRGLSPSQGQILGRNAVCGSTQMVQRMLGGYNAMQIVWQCCAHAACLPVLL